MESHDLLGLIVQAAIALGAAVIAVLALWLLYQLARLLFLRLPSWLVGQRAPVFLSILFALLLTPRLSSYIFSVVTDLIDAFPGSIQALTSWNSEVLAACTDDCMPQILRSFGAGVGDLLWRITEAFQLRAFPVTDFIWFLVFLAVLNIVLRYIRDRLTSTPVGTPRVRAVERGAFVNLIFLAIVGVAFYLSLSSLLAIPLIQTQAVAQGFAADDLDKALNEASLTQAELDQRFPDITTKIETAAPPSNSPVMISDANSEIIDQTVVLADQAGEYLSTARAAALAEITSLRSQGLRAFTSQNALRLGGRETVDHFAAILTWHSDEKRRIDRQFSPCLAGVRSAMRVAVALVDDLRTPPPPTESIDLDTLERAERDALGRYLIVKREFDRAAPQCDVTQANTPPRAVPSRPSRSSSLKAVGQWTEWLLGTESMPLVIIVGLVGFSLLGATMSRIVRAGARRGLDGLSLADVLKVVAGGVAAAMVVFLASYGGLAVLGETKTDPSPYVVFVLCLVGAIFSEDIWEWGRKKLLGSVVGDNPPTPPPPGPTPEPADPVPEPEPVNPVPQGPTRRGRRRPAG